MARYIWFAAVHALLTVSGWYFVSAAAQGAADGIATAPLWLKILNECVLVLMWPLGRLALSLDPFWGSFSMPGFAAFTVVAAVNSAVIAALVWLMIFVGYRALINRKQRKA